MPRILFPWLLAVTGLLCACSPAMNWRGVSIDDTSLEVLLPCKPDRGSRPVALGPGAVVQVHMTGCEVEGALFAVGWIDAGSAAEARTLAASWQAAMLAAMRADAPEVRALEGARGALAQAVRVVARGRRPDGRAVSAQGLWWTSGGRVFHAALYAEALKADLADTFFAGIENP